MAKKLLVAAALLLVFYLPTTAATPASLELFVDARMGNDMGSCRAAGNACRTIQAAIDRIPAVLMQDVIVHLTSGTYLESVLLADRLAPQGHGIRLIGEPEAIIKSSPSLSGDGITIRRSALVVLENLVVEGFTNGIHVRLSDVVINNTRIDGNSQNGILCEKAWVTLQRAGDGPGVVIQNNLGGSGISAMCGSHVQFEGVAWIGENGTGLTATFAAVIDLNGRSDVTLANVVVPAPPATEPPPTTVPPGTTPSDRMRRPLEGEFVTASFPCEMVVDHMGLIIGYGNARTRGDCACTAKDLSLCHPDPD